MFLQSSSGDAVQSGTSGMNLLSLVSGENSVRFACPKKRDGAVFSRILASIYQTTRSHTTLHFKCYKGTLHADMPTWVTP